MKTRILIILAALLLAPAAIVRAAPQDILTVAVFDFDSKDEAVSDLGPKVATLVNANLSAEPQIITVERAELNKVLGEQELGLSGTVTPDSAAKIGQLTGAKVLVTGRVFKVDDQTIIVAKVIGTETGRVYGEMVQGAPAKTIVDLSSDLAKKIASVVSEKSDTLVARVETREGRIAKIKQALAGKKLPVVSVKIGEQHFGRLVVDPAAQTELSVILQQCGFTLADNNSTNKPAIEISGDAFSAYGMQKGNLISCKSRIEIKVRDVATGNILAVDRQTSVGVDVAEQTAAKTALENAMDVLAERVVPKLASQ
jgi:TolB-like protein